jgi:hypothetical protein
MYIPIHTHPSCICSFIRQTVLEDIQLPPPPFLFNPLYYDLNFCRLWVTRLPVHSIAQSTLLPRAITPHTTPEERTIVSEAELSPIIR